MTTDTFIVPAPLVSVITATFNAANSLESCMESVRAQDYPSVEHIVVDGGSSDNTLGVLQRCANQNVRWISEPDKGIYDAWNKGLALANGRWIAFLGADDLYLPGAISAYMKAASAFPEAMYISSRVRWIGPGGRARVIGEPWRWPRFQRFMCSAHVGSVHRRDLFDTYGKYDTSYRMTADYELLLRARGGLKTAFIPDVTAQMQWGGTTDSAACLPETARAKLESGGRSRLATLFDHFWGLFVFHTRRQAQIAAAKLRGKASS